METEYSATSDSQASKNASLERIEAKNDKSSGLLRSYRMIKPKKDTEENSTNLNLSSVIAAVKNSERKVESQSNIAKKSNPCIVCEESFDIREKLTQHLIEKHGYRRTFQCPICKKKFASRDSIKKHMEENHKSNANKKKHQCMICDDSFDMRENLTKHINDIHDSYYKNAFLKKSQSSNIFMKKQGETKNSNYLSTPSVKVQNVESNNNIKKKLQHPCSLCEASYNDKPNLVAHLLVTHQLKVTLS